MGTQVAGLAGVRVLVVDDQEHVRAWTRTVLGSMGITDVTETVNGREAVAAVSRPGAWFDLVLCDLRMPDSDGIETLRAFASLGVQSGFAIVSGEDERVIDTTALLAEARGLRLLGTVQKPVTAHKLEKLFATMQRRITPAGGSAVVAPEGDLEKAFERDEFLLMYQPKIALKTGLLTGVEALVRWQHPEFGLFPPNAFVPIIEASPDMSVRFAEFTLREALGCAGRARAQGKPISVAVNLSRRTCDRLDLPETIERMCAQQNVPTEHVTLEITETAVAHDALRLLDVATRLRLKGFALSIDDFGTGESGLSQLKRLPFTELKIDREFVDGCARSATQRSVVEASLALARSLHMTAVAEGVQSRSDWDVLRALECDVVQGFYVATPMPEAQILSWAERATPFGAAPGTRTV